MRKRATLQPHYKRWEIVNCATIVGGEYGRIPALKRGKMTIPTFVRVLPLRLGAMRAVCWTSTAMSRKTKSNNVVLRRTTVTRRVALRRSLCMSVQPTSEAGPKAAEEAIKNASVIVFSTTYCPFCARVKNLFSDLGVNHAVWDVDVMSNGSAIRSWLQDYTGQRTVPNVFIRGKHVGGCDGTFCILGREQYDCLH